MIRAFLEPRRAGSCAIVAPALPTAARATLVADPAVLYAQMKDAYGKGAADGWNFRVAGDLPLDDLQRRPRVLAAVSRRSGIRRAGDAHGAYRRGPALQSADQSRRRRVVGARGGRLGLQALRRSCAAVASADAAARVNSEDDPAALARFADAGCDRQRARPIRATSTRCSCRSRPTGAPGC